jgi:NADH:ubiquinone oxidoreductase subunit 2 (subunit N)
VAFGFASRLYAKSPTATASSPTRSAVTARAVRGTIVAASGLLAIGDLVPRALRAGPRRRVLRAARRGRRGMCFFVGANNLMTLFLGLEWFSICLYILCAIDRDRLGALEAALKYLIDRRASARRCSCSAPRSSTAPRER